MSATYGVIGEGAKAASRGSNAYEGVTATAVRLYKYVVGYYYQDFVTSCHEWARSTVASWPPRLADQPLAAALQDLCTAHVVPEEVLAHLADVAAFREDQRRAITERWQTFLVKHLLCPEDHPTLTRCSPSVRAWTACSGWPCWTFPTRR